MNVSSCLKASTVTKNITEPLEGNKNCLVFVKGTSSIPTLPALKRGSLIPHTLMDIGLVKGYVPTERL